jgi:hypothetical protein
MRRPRPPLRLAPLLAAALLGCSLEGSTPLTAGLDPTIAGIRLEPRPVTARVGTSTPVVVLPVTSDGVAVTVPLNNSPQLRTGDARIAAVRDSGSVTGVAPGTTWLHATVGRWRDSVAVTVLP